MEELVALQKIDVQVEARDWKDALYKAGDLLVRSGDIEKEYIDHMIEAVEEYGPYIVIGKGFALGHAAPCEEVKNTAVSLINLKEGIEFGSRNDPVKVVMCLACRDKEAHMAYLQKIAARLMEENMVEKLGSCSSKEELYRLINKKEEEE